MGCDQRMMDPGETRQHFRSQFKEQAGQGIRYPQNCPGPMWIRNDKVAGLNQVFEIESGEVTVHCREVPIFFMAPC